MYSIGISLTLWHRLKVWLFGTKIQMSDSGCTLEGRIYKGVIYLTKESFDKWPDY